MLQSKLNGRNQETKLVACVVARSLKAHGVKRTLLQFKLTKNICKN